MFEPLSTRHSDKGVWKLLDRQENEVVDVSFDGPAPRDLDIWEVYRAVLLEAAGA